MFKCRTLKPAVSDWYEVDSGTPEEAANDFHTKYSDRLISLNYSHVDAEGKDCKLSFALIEIEGHGELVSRYYSYGIRRKGGVKVERQTPAQKLKAIADELGWTKDPALLVEEGWEGAESYEEAVGKGAF